MLKFDRLAIDVAQFSWLRKKRWQPLLTDISLAVQPGELVALEDSEGYIEIAQVNGSAQEALSAQIDDIVEVHLNG